MHITALIACLFTTVVLVTFIVQLVVNSLFNDTCVHIGTDFEVHP